MTATYAGTGARADGLASAAGAGSPGGALVPIPAGSVGDGLLIPIWQHEDTSPHNAAPTCVTASHGLTKLVEVLGTMATGGTDTGRTRLALFWKEYDGTEPAAYQFNGSGDNGGQSGKAYRFTKPAGTTWDAAAVGGEDTVSGTAWSAALSAIDFEVGDLCFFINSIGSDGPTWSSEGVAATGITFGSQAEVEEVKTSNGYDLGGFVASATVTAGAATVAPTVTATCSSSATVVQGPTVLVRLRTPVAPPGVPTSVSADPDLDMIALTWSAPASGGAVADYDVRIDGGSSTDVDLATSHDFTGLSPGTAYTVSVRARNAGGSSAWVDVPTETDLDGPLTDYAAKVRIGSHVWEIEAGDTADGTLDVLAGVTFIWAAPDNVGWPPPMWTVPRDVLQLRVRATDATDVSDVRKGDVVRFKFTPFGYDFSAPLIDFAGLITADPVISDDRGAGVILSVVASDYRVILTNWSIDAGDGSAPIFNNGDTIEEALQAWCSAIDPFAFLAPGLPGDFGDVTVGAVDPNSRLTGTLGHDITYSGFVSASRGFQDLRVLPVPQYDDDGDLDPVQPFRMVEVDSYGRDYATPDPVPASLVPNATLEWRRDFTPTVLEITGVTTIWQGAAQGDPYPTDMDQQVILRVSSTEGFNTFGLQNEVPETNPWAPFTFQVLAWRDPETVRNWFNYPERVEQYVTIDGIELVKNPSGTDTVAGMLKAATFTLGRRGRWTVRAGLRPHHFDATLS